MDERLSLRPAEAARAIGVGRTTLYALVRAKAIPFFRVNGKSIRIPINALRDWVSQQTAAVRVDTPIPSAMVLDGAAAKERTPRPVRESSHAKSSRTDSSRKAT